MKHCLVVLKQRPFGEDIKAVGFTAGGDSTVGRAEVTFAISSQLKSRRRAGVATHAPFHVVEDRGGELRVSWWDTAVPAERPRGQPQPIGSGP
jgi:hypothetical protein